MASHARRSCVLRRALRSTSVVVLGTGLLAIPVASAQAMFSVSARATVSASTLLLEAPASYGTQVASSCTGKNKKHHLDISVDAFASVAGANYHSLTIRDPSGEIQQEGDLTTQAGRSYSDSRAVAGAWTYEIRGDYRVPGSTNVWMGKPLQGTVICR
ncbi:hypothetical protein IV500_05360 [Paeniglutamicibacter antarcticus]|uniref:Uncharacterized protein n=1 Tax=Arthrobacter terrae TaxID=2935737 RepID=A0A931CSD4_9MICC|nr:hypothetical protein [Arthrobacter terrae]MBG0738848.1 hypothetical protein [Arthrobacter terrae]